MRKQIIIGCFISIIALLLVPSIPAAQYNMVEEAQVEAISDAIIQQVGESSSFSVEEMKEILSESLSSDQSITKLDIQDIYEQLDLQKQQTDENGEPLFFPFLGIFIYLLIFYIIYIVIITILREIFDFIDVIVGNIASKIQNFIQGIINIFITILTLVFMLLKTIVEVIGALGLGILNGLASLLVGIYNVVVLVLQGIATLLVLAVQGLGTLLVNIWQGFGAFFRLIIDIFDLILDAIFPNMVS